MSTMICCDDYRKTISSQLTSVKVDTSIVAVGIDDILLKAVLSTKLPVTQHIKILKV